MATADKLITVAENVPKVYHSGQLNIVKNAECLKNNKNGSAILIDDISPITHDMSVKVRCKNLFDLTSVLNASNWDSSLTVSGYGNYAISGLKPNTDYTFSMGSNGWSGVADNGFYVSLYGSAITWRGNYSICHNSGDSGYCNTAITIQSNENGMLYLQFYNATNERLSAFFEKCPDIQLELGTTATAYTPYVPDLTAVKVSRYGKNLWDKDYAVLDSRWTQIGGNYAYIRIPVPKGSSVSVSYKKTLDIGIDMHSYIRYASSDFDANRGQKWLYHKTVSSMINKSFTVVAQQNYIDVVTIVVSGAPVYLNRFMENIGNDLQIEISPIVTDYEPYITKVDYTPTADGTVEGVTSLYPNTTLTTDTDGVIIDCEYYKDIDKAYNKLSAEIALSGGE